MTPDGTQPAPGRSTGTLITVAFAVGALMLVTSGVIHLYLWGKDDGYRHVKTIGPLFLLQGIAGCVLGVAVIGLRRSILALAGAVYMAGSMSGLSKAINGGLFDYHETLNAPYVKTSLTIEVVGLAAFTTVLVLTFIRSRRHDSLVR